MCWCAVKKLLIHSLCNSCMVWLLGPPLLFLVHQSCLWAYPPAAIQSYSARTQSRALKTPRRLRAKEWHWRTCWVAKQVSHFVGYSLVGGFGQTEWSTEVDDWIVGSSGNIGGSRGVGKPRNSDRSRSTVHHLSKQFFSTCLFVFQSHSHTSCLLSNHQCAFYCITLNFFQSTIVQETRTSK